MPLRDPGRAGEPAPGFDLVAGTGRAPQSELLAEAGCSGRPGLVLDLVDSGMDGDPPPGSLCALDSATVTGRVRTVTADVDPVVLSLDAR